MDMFQLLNYRAHYLKVYYNILAISWSHTAFHFGIFTKKFRSKLTLFISICVFLSCVFELFRFLSNPFKSSNKSNRLLTFKNSIINIIILILVSSDFCHCNKIERTQTPSYASQTPKSNIRGRRKHLYLYLFLYPHMYDFIMRSGWLKCVFGHSGIK